MRLPGWRVDRTQWRQADVATDDLTPIFDGADAVVHLAWLFQPTRHPAVTWRANVLGSMRVFRAAAEAGVPALVHASSVGAYSPGPKDRPVDESWPTHGWPGAAYGREKAYVERVLDVFEHDHPHVRVVRMRPGFIFQRAAATEQRRLFGGPFVPRRLVRAGRIPFVPDIPGLRMQVLHAADAAEAYRLAVTRQVRGAFNIAAEPVLDPHDLAELLGARTVPVPSGLARAAVAARLAPAARARRARAARTVPAHPGHADGPGAGGARLDPAPLLLRGHAGVVRRHARRRGDGHRTAGARRGTDGPRTRTGHRDRRTPVRT